MALYVGVPILIGCPHKALCFKHIHVKIAYKAGNTEHAEGSEPVYHPYRRGGNLPPVFEGFWINGRQIAAPTNHYTEISLKNLSRAR